MTPAESQHEQFDDDVREPAPDAGAAPPAGEEPTGAAQEWAAEAAAADEAADRDADEENLADESPTDLVADLAAARQALAERTADLQRIQAEYVNYKRRVDRDRDLVRENATFTVLSRLLPVLDDLDRARDHGELEGGFKAVADSLERIVAGLGLEKYGRPGDAFDPRLHEALMHAHSPDVTTTTCQHVVQAGYRIGERVVRPARVTVVDPEPGEPTERGEPTEPGDRPEPDGTSEPGADTDPE